MTIPAYTPPALPEVVGAAGDRLEANLDAIAEGVTSGDARFWLKLGGDYIDECVGS